MVPACFPSMSYLAALFLPVHPASAFCLCGSFAPLYLIGCFCMCNYTQCAIMSVSSCIRIERGGERVCRGRLPQRTLECVVCDVDSCTRRQPACRPRHHPRPIRTSSPPLHNDTRKPKALMQIKKRGNTTNGGMLRQSFCLTCL